MMQRDQLFVRLPLSALYDDRLSKSAVLLLAVLIDTADQYGMRQTYIDTLADECHASPATIRRAEAQLCDAGYITISRTGRASLLRVLIDTVPIRQTSGIQAYKRKEGTA